MNLKKISNWSQVLVRRVTNKKIRWILEICLEHLNYNNVDVNFMRCNDKRSQLIFLFLDLQTTFLHPKEIHRKG